MKKILGIAASLLITFQLSAQDVSHSLSVGVSVLLNRTASQPASYFPVDGGFSASPDVHVIYGLSKSLSLQAGLGMERFKYTEHGLYFPSSIDPQTGRMGGEVFIDMHLSYLSLPLKLNYMPGTDKVHFLASAGITPAYLLSAKRKAYQKDGSNDPDVNLLNQKPDITQQYQRFTLFPTISIGAAYQATHHLMFTAGLGFEDGLIPPSGNLSSLMAFGLNVGAAWRMK